EEATAAYEGARERVRKFLYASSPREIIFTRNATESINLIASVLGEDLLRASDHVLISRAEHHSNFLPWQKLRDTKGAILDIIDPDDQGKISLEAIREAIHPKTKLAAFSHVSHVLGTINPVQEWGQFFRERGILFLVDAAQSAAHIPINVQEIQCDFLAFSGHKVGGPMGIGVLFGREELLKKFSPFLLGGGMIREVRVESSSWHDLPWKFEAGTPNVEGAVGLAASLEYIDRVGFDNIHTLENELMHHTLSELQLIQGIRIFGPKDPLRRSSVISFVVDGVHPHDLATILDRDGVAIRAGHHCAMPLMEHIRVPATARVSFWVYNTPKDVDSFIAGVKKAIQILHDPRSRELNNSKSGSQLVV
ncbi:MAG: cysteine desulfurase, partial [bacterium]|nr:cysteine desulfurase [bacterium]